MTTVKPAGAAKKRRNKALEPTANELAVQRERDRKVVELALGGATYKQIAEQLGFADASGPWRAMRRALERQESDRVEEYRDLEGARLDRLQLATWPKALAGDLAAVRTVLRIMERRARLFGLDTQAAVVAAIPADVLLEDPAQRARRLAEMRDRLQDELAAARARKAAGQ